MAKGGKGRKGGGGGGGKTRKYSRDSNGRFASTGTGATARGGRLLTAKGNKRTARALAGKTKTIEAKGQKGVLAKPKGLKPGAIKPKATANKVVASPRRLSGDQKIARDVMTNKKLTSDRQRIAEMQRRGIKPGTDMVGLVAGVRAKQGGGTTARIKPAAKSPKFTTEQSGRVRRAALGGGRTAIVRKNSAVIINAKGEPIMTRKGLPNITAGKKYAANPNARGPRLMGRDRSEASPSRGYIRTSKPTGTIGKPKGLKPGSIKPKAAAAKPATRKEQLAAGAKKRTAQADRIDAKIKKLESEYRGKDAAFYTQGAKPAGRDRMIAKSQKAAQLREESASLRTKAANAERMSSKIKDKPIKSSGGNKRLDRAIKNEAAGSTSYKRNPKGYQKRITALTAQKVYQTGDFMSGLSLAQSYGKGFRLPRNQRAAAAKPAAPKASKASKAPKGGMRATKRVPLAPDSATAKRLTMFKSGKQLTDQRTKSLREGLKKETDPVQKIKTSSSISESQLKSKSYGDDITRMQARPIMGKRTGIGRGDKPVSGPAAKRPNTIKGKPKRDAGVAAKVKPGINLNAGRYRNIYRDRANAKGKAAAKAAKRPMR